MRAGRHRRALLAAVLATACAGAPTAAAAAQDAGERVVIGVRGDVDSLNIYTASTILSQEVADLLFLRLATERDDFADGPPTFEPALARRWTASPDGLTIEFELDERARWSDGRPVTARDVVFSHEAAASAEVGWAGRDVKQSIESVTAAGDHRVLFRFRRPSPYQLMDAAEGNILPAHHYGGVPFSDWPKTGFTTAPVVSGPYRLASYRPGEAIVLERNPSWAGPPAGVPRIVFRILPDVATLLVELESGGIDMMENVPAAQVDRLRANPRLELTTIPDLSYTFVCWNLRSPLFADARVRRALTLAIDRQAIVDGVLFGNGGLLASPILSMFWAHDRSIAPHPHDPVRARALLGEAGWSDTDGDGVIDKDGRPFRFVLESNQGSQLRNDTAVMVQADLRKVGIDAQPRVVEWKAFLQKHDAHDFDAFVGGHREATRVDPTSLLHSSGIEGGYNHAGYASKAMDDLIERARAEAATQKARSLWSGVQALFHQEQPFTILFEMKRVNAVNRRVTGVRMSPRSAFVSLPSWRVKTPEAKPAATH